MSKPDWIAAKEDGYQHVCMKCPDISKCFRCTSSYAREESWARYHQKQMELMGWYWDNQLRDWALPSGTSQDEYNKKKDLYYSLLGCNQHCTNRDCKVENCSTYY